jgi:hypothetical protein
MDGSIYLEPLKPIESRVSYDLDLGDGLVARLAVSQDVLRDAWALRYKAYASHGFIETSDSEMFADDCDFYPSSKVVVVYRRGRPVGTVRICLYAPGSGLAGAHTLPILEVFPDEIKAQLAAVPTRRGAPRAVEVMRLSTDPELGFDPEVSMALFLMAGYVTMYFGATAAFCGVRRHHMPLYRRFGWRKMTEPRPYPKLKFETGLMGCVSESPEGLRRDMPIMHPISKDDEIFEDLMAGRSVPAYGGERDRTAITRQLSGRMSRPAAIEQVAA